MEENKAQTESKYPNIDNLVNNYIDDIFSNASDKLQKGNTQEQENTELENYTKNLVDDIFKTSLDDVKEKKKKKKKKDKNKDKNKTKNKKFRLKTLTIDTRIDVIDEEDDSDEAHEDNKKVKNEIQNEIKNEIKDDIKINRHSKSNSIDFIPEQYMHKINNRKNIKKLQLVRPPSTFESNDDFYLSKFINNKQNGNDDICILF